MVVLKLLLGEEYFFILYPNVILENIKVYILVQYIKSHRIIKTESDNMRKLIFATILLLCCGLVSAEWVCSEREYHPNSYVVSEQTCYQFLDCNLVENTEFLLCNDGDVINKVGYKIIDVEWLQEELYSGNEERFNNAFGWLQILGADIRWE